jgi:hypothetical protein
MAYLKAVVGGIVGPLFALILSVILPSLVAAFISFHACGSINGGGNDAGGTFTVVVPDRWLPVVFAIVGFGVGAVMTLFSRQRWKERPPSHPLDLDV